MDHTGEPTWLQRAWAGVLVSWPAALSHHSALRAGEGPGRRIQYDDTIHVAIDRQRHLRAPDGVTLHRLERFDERVLSTASSRPRLGRREWIEGVLHDIAAGACSVLEHGYLTRVERPHGLDVGRRQQPQPSSKGIAYCDGEYASGLDFDRSCRTADKVGLLLRRGGWTGVATPCGPACAVVADCG